MQGLLQMVRFGAVGCLNTALGLAAIYACLFFFGASAEIANVIGYSVALCVSFQLNKTWTFASLRKSGEAAPRYALVVAIAYLVNLGAVSMAAGGGVNPYLAQLCGVAPYAILNFLGCRFYVFPRAGGAEQINCGRDAAGNLHG